MKKFYVYIHTCPNGKKYVGATTQDPPQRRWRAYGGELRKDIQKYGWKNFTHELFEVESEEEMYRKEIELISFYHSNDPRYGYNSSTGGELSARGCKRSEETRKKISEARKGKKIVWPKHKYLLPNGEIKTLMTSHATRYYIKKSISIIKLD